MTAALRAGLALALVTQMALPVGVESEAGGEWVTIRLTAYLPTGYPTASGHWPFVGSAACSRMWPFGTTFTFEDGRIAHCNDRGEGDYYWPGGWVDLFAETMADVYYLRALYGDYVSVLVRPP